MWSCPNCPAGCPHIWKTSVRYRTRGTKCPFCQGKRICQHNSLATRAPRQTRYWNHDKNANTPEQTLAGSRLSGSALSAAMSGKLQLLNVCYMTVVVLDAAKYFVLETKTNSQHLKQCNTHCCLIGTMSATPRTIFILTTPPLAAISWCIGCVTTAQRDTCTSFRRTLIIVLASTLQGAHTVPARERVNAILCKRITPRFHQNGTLPEMT